MHPQLRVLTLLTLIFSISRCAQPVTPTGGDKDITPPKLTATQPLEKQTNIFPEKLTFEFDENIVLTQPEKNITISPAINEKNIKITHSNKSIHILLNQHDLSPNTTYSISFNDAISDLNEGNKAQLPPYLFSTGNTLDTSTIIIQPQFYYTEKNQNLKIILMEFRNDEKHFQGKYLNGCFSITGLDSNIKTALIFNDENNNNYPDSTEDIGISYTLKPGTDDTSMVKMYKQKKTIIYNKYDNLYHYSYGYTIELLQNILLSDSNIYHIHDTIFYPVDYIPTFIKLLDIKNYILSQKTEINSPTPVFYSTTELRQDKVYATLEFNKIISSINNNTLYFINGPDTLQIQASHVSYRKNQLYIGIPDSLNNHQIIIPENTISFQNYTKHIPGFTIKISADVPGEITLENTFDSTLTGHIFSDKYQFPFTIPPQSKTTLSVPRGTYDMVSWHDSNEDFIISPPIFSESIQGESWYYIKSITSSPKLENVIYIK